ncbi:hypothetical protein QBC43DRAFT_312443 [Cladorrhinum sp. PSN259]|nr:hypothetical protein QBC43DRAFT_312443 [Cladorrhinum sp. PSN259]
MSLQAAKPSICGVALSACRTTTTPVVSVSRIQQAFSTSTSNLARKRTPVPPESPKFIVVPEPPQSSETRLPPIRGHLPVPRTIFPKREADRKVQAGYVEAATPKSYAELAEKPPKSAEEQRHRLDAASRRAALEAGIKGLWARKVTTDQRMIRQSRKKAADNLKAANAPERLDEVLTRSTVRADTANNFAVALDPGRFVRANAAKQRHEHMLKKKAEARADALAQLYVEAKNFIVDEATLEERVNKLFAQHKDSYTGPAGENIWALEGHPISVRQMQARMAGDSEYLMDSAKTPQEKTTTRQKSVAEELTGGRL